MILSLPQDVAISPRQRDEVIQWLAKLKYQFHLYPETLALAISLLDRFLAAVKVNICSSRDGNAVGVRGLSGAARQKRFLPPALPCPAHTWVGSNCSALEPQLGGFGHPESSPCPSPGCLGKAKAVPRATGQPSDSSNRDRRCSPP